MYVTIIIRKPDPQDIQTLQTKPIWTCEPSEFDYAYDQTETCLILAGKVEVTYNNTVYAFQAGDLVVFEKGVKCRWHILEAVKKHYQFTD